MNAMRCRPRTKAALAAAKGKKLEDYKRIAEAKQAATRARAEAVRPMITETLHLTS